MAFKRRLGLALLNRFGWMLGDKAFIKCLFYSCIGKRLDLKSPKTYNEKLNWLKIYDHNPLYTTLVDKYAVKDYVSKIIGDKYVIPTLGVWDKPEDIEWDKLPDRFVLKTTHGGGGDGVVICKDKASLDVNKALLTLQRGMKTDPFKRSREWPYKNVPKRIIAEKYMEDTTYGELRDYKFFAFDGEVKAMFIATDRGSGNVKFDFFDENFNHLDLVQTHPLSGLSFQKPEEFEVMKEIASKLSKGIPHVRVDLYVVDGRVYFGEMTFFHHGGIHPFHPSKWDDVFGSWIKLPSRKQ